MDKERSIILVMVGTRIDIDYHYEGIDIQGRVRILTLCLETIVMD